jgi:rhamnosyltransferase
MIPASESQVVDKSSETVCAQIGAAIVLYQPDVGLLNRLLRSLEGQVSEVFVVDNTPGSSPAFSSFFTKYPLNIRYIPLGENRGIAEAQNVAIRQSREAGCSHVLLLDQDSALSPGMVAELLRAERELTCRGVRVAAVGPLFIDEKTGEASRAIRHGYLRVRKVRIDRYAVDPMESDYLIASGALIRTCVFDAVGIMRDDLFIDWVDIEWGLRARVREYQSYIVPKAVMAHSIGDRTVRVLGKDINLHSNIRHYYLVRNAAYLLRMRHMGMRWRSVTLLKIPQYVIVYSFYSKKRLKSLRLLFRAVLDGLFGRMGRRS